MISSLLFLLFFETAQPSLATFQSFFPDAVVAEAKILQLGSSRTPVQRGESIGPGVQAKSIFSIDVETGVPLVTQNIFERRPIASITKLMTAMVILDRHSLDEKIRVGRRAVLQEGSKMWLAPGEEITVRNLLTGLLIVSGNDAAVALAEFDAGSEKAFVEKMNEKAATLGLQDTNFSNAKGFDEANNYSTAFDILTFSRAALSYDFIRKTTALKQTKVSSTNGKITHHLESTNELLENSYFSIVGLKTGRTPGAGESFVSLMKAPNNHEVLTAVLGSPDRFRETKIVLDWVQRNFEFP